MQKELRQVKNDISQQSKRNFELENDLRFFDSKIAHLINHRITVEVSLYIVCHYDSLPSGFKCQWYFVTFYMLFLIPQELENRLEETPSLPGKKIQYFVCMSPPSHNIKVHIIFLNTISLVTLNFLCYLGHLQDSFQNQVSKVSSLCFRCNSFFSYQLYGQMFFLLQTNPMYIAKLSREVSLKEIDGMCYLSGFRLLYKLFAIGFC